MSDLDNPVAAFIDAACVPLDQSHASGTLAEADAILTAHPSVAASSVHTAAILGDDAAVRRFLTQDPASATAKGGPRGWDALTHLCFSRYLRLDPVRSEGFVRAAEALLDAGASANTGWWETHHQPEPEWESALYGRGGHRAPRRAHAPSAAARRGSQRQRGALPRPRKLRQRRSEGTAGNRKAHAGKPVDHARPQA